MPDPVTPVAPVAPVEAVSAPSTPVQPAPAVVAPAVAAPVVEPVSASSAPVQPAQTVLAEAPKAPETVLGEAMKPAVAPVVPQEVKPVTAEVKTPEGKSDEPAPPPVYDPFTLPDGVTLDKERSDKFTSILAELETNGKVNHALVQQFGQKAVDFHLEEVKRATQEVQDTYLKTFERQKTEWKDSVLKDPEMGGQRFQATVDSALTFIRTHGGTPEQQTEFRNLMEESGLGNHPAMIRLLANAGKAMSEGVPLAAQRPVSAVKSKIETMYGKQALV